MTENNKFEKVSLNDKMEESPLFSKRFYEKMRLFALAGLLLMPGYGIASKNKNESTETSTSQLENNPNYNDSLIEQFNKIKLESPHIHNTFFIKNEKTGVIETNWWALLAPFQVELPWTKDGVKDSYNVLHDYARLFISAGALNNKEYSKISELMEQEIKQQLVEVLYGLDISKKAHEANEAPNFDQLKIESINITGTASPEGPAYKGPETIESVDPENLKLAHSRGVSGFDEIIKSLKKLGINPDEKILQKALYGINFEEVQFSPDEMNRMAELSRDYFGSDSLEKIFNMIVDYNDKKISDPNLVLELDSRVASKRSVEIEIEYSGKLHRSFLVPIPLLLFILPFIFGDGRKKYISKISKNGSFFNENYDTLIKSGSGAYGDSESAGISNIGKIGGPDKVSEVSITSSGNVEKISEAEKIGSANAITETEKISENFLKYYYSSTIPEGKDSEQMEEATWIDDLYNYFDSEIAIKRGLSYRAITDSILYDSKIFKNSDEIELKLTFLILNKWTEHDLAARREAGVDENVINDGLNYTENNEQIKWARMHAKAIIEIVKMKKENPNKDYEELLAIKVQQLQKRRTF